MNWSRPKRVEHFSVLVLPLPMARLPRRRTILDRDLKLGSVINPRNTRVPFLSAWLVHHPFLQKLNLTAFELCW